MKHKKCPWYENSPPEWYRKLGRYGIWTSLLISAIALVIAIIKLG